MNDLFNEKTLSFFCGFLNLFVFAAMKKFLHDKLAQGDVWMVGIKQVIEWIKTPVSLDDIENFSPWKCDSPPPPPACNTPNVCSFPGDSHYLWTCTRPCPKHYPWVGNPDGNWQNEMRVCPGRMHCFFLRQFHFSNEIKSGAIIGIMAPDKMLLFARMEFISSLIKPIIYR